MITRSMAALVLASLTLASPALAQSGGWDGKWGNPAKWTIAIAGKSVSYTFGGKSYPVSNVTMTPGSLSFNFGTAGKLAMTRTPDGKARYSVQVGTSRQTGPIWKRG